MRRFCGAHNEGAPERYPAKKAAPKRKSLRIAFAWVKSRVEEERLDVRLEEEAHRIRRAVFPGLAYAVLALMAAYEQLGHRAGMIRCLLAQNQPLAWSLHFPPRV